MAKLWSNFSSLKYPRPSKLFQWHSDSSGVSRDPAECHYRVFRSRFFDPYKQISRYDFGKHSCLIASTSALPRLGGARWLRSYFKSHQWSIWGRTI